MEKIQSNGQLTKAKQRRTTKVKELRQIQDRHHQRRRQLRHHPKLQLLQLQRQLQEQEEERLFKNQEEDEREEGNDTEEDNQEDEGVDEGEELEEGEQQERLKNLTDSCTNVINENKSDELNDDEANYEDGDDDDDDSENDANGDEGEETENVGVEPVPVLLFGNETRGNDDDGQNNVQDKTSTKASNCFERVPSQGDSKAKSSSNSTETEETLIPPYMKLMHLIAYTERDRYCRYCPRRSNYICTGCPDRPQLHPKRCFIEYHKGVFHDKFDSS